MKKKSRKSRKSMKKKSRKSRKSSNKSNKCVKKFTKKYIRRVGPPYPAQDCKNQYKVGNDGYLYRSTPDKNGVYKWGFDL